MIHTIAQQICNGSLITLMLGMILLFPIALIAVWMLIIRHNTIERISQVFIEKIVIVGLVAYPAMPKPEKCNTQVCKWLHIVTQAKQKPPRHIFIIKN
jgi:antibiotic biosynthesis monooxygenase (ABM) superfamily enzyme